MAVNSSLGSFSDSSWSALERLTVQQLQQKLHSGALTSQALTQQVLQRAADPQGEGGRVFTHVFHAQASQWAQASDVLRVSGWVRSGLEGIPVSIKDLFDVQGLPTTAGSQVLRTAAVAPQHGTVMQRLLHAGAVVVGRTNMTEFAYSGLGLNPHYGTPANPWERERRRIPGGSSSGAAIALTDGMCFASVGSDTGGSVRIPAALCGLTGFKPTARRIPQEGMLPLSTQLDSVGVLGADVQTCAVLDHVLSGTAFLSGAKEQGGFAWRDVSRARFAVPTTLVLEGMDASVARSYEQALERLARAGAVLTEVDVPEFLELTDFNAGGGFSAAESWAWHAGLIEQQAHAYDPRVLTRIERGRGFTAQAWLKLLAQRQDWQRRVSERLSVFDAWLMPTVPMVAPLIADLQADDSLYFSANAAMLRNPSIVNFMDGCAMTLPCHEAGQAPAGLSLVAGPMQDMDLLHWAQAVECVVKMAA